MPEELTTEQKILEAAKAEFLEKGYNGARTSEIARRAGINKALLHYYFRNKERLFEEVFGYYFGQILPAIGRIVETDAPILDKLEQIVHRYIDFFGANPDLPLFLLSELRLNPAEFLERIIALKRGEFSYLRQLAGQMMEAAAAGEIRPVHPVHIMMNVISMCIFPFIARPMIINILEVPEPAFNELISQRKQVISDFIRHALAT